MQVAFVYLPNRERDPWNFRRSSGSSVNYRCWHSASSLEKEKVEWEGKCLLFWALCILDMGRLERLGQIHLLLEIWVLGPRWCPVVPHGDSVSLVKLAFA